MNKALKALVAVAAVGAISSAAQAALIVNFIPSPSSPNLPEIVYSDAGVLSEGAGARGNGDGAMPPPLQTAGGLRISTPFVINGVAGSEVNLVEGSTSFFDTTLEISDIPSAGAASAPGGGAVLQPLGGGAFSLTGTDGTLLLSGTLTDGVITGLLNTNAAAVLSLTVNYSGGLIATASAAAGNISTGSLSFSLLDVAPVISIAPSGRLSGFTANATGLFSAEIPEPASAMLLLAGLPLVAVRRRRS